MKCSLNLRCASLFLVHSSGWTFSCPKRPCATALPLRRRPHSNTKNHPIGTSTLTSILVANFKFSGISSASNGKCLSCCQRRDNNLRALQWILNRGGYHIPFNHQPLRNPASRRSWSQLFVCQYLFSTRSSQNAILVAIRRSVTVFRVLCAIV